MLDGMAVRAHINVVIAPTLILQGRDRRRKRDAEGLIKLLR
jgi:hypothetical protein